MTFREWLREKERIALQRYNIGGDDSYSDVADALAEAGREFNRRFTISLLSTAFEHRPGMKPSQGWTEWVDQEEQDNE